MRNVRIPVGVRGVAIFKVGDDERSITNAGTRFLEAQKGQMHDLVREVELAAAAKAKQIEQIGASEARVTSRRGIAEGEATKARGEAEGACPGRLGDHRPSDRAGGPGARDGPGGPPAQPERGRARALEGLARVGRAASPAARLSAGPRGRFGVDRRRWARA